MNIKIELLGYKGTLTDIRHRLAFPPWRPDDELLVGIRFEEPYPASIMSTAISIPVSDYSREGFLRLVKEEGEKQLAIDLEEHHKRRRKSDRDAQRQEELQALADSLTAEFEGGGDGA